MTLVVDASAIAELLAHGPRARQVLTVLERDARWRAPEHLRLEVASALRGRLLGGYLTSPRFTEALTELAEFDIDSHSTVPLLPRIGELAQNANPYDAAYIALSERLEAPLITIDSKLARIPGAQCEVEII